MNPSAVLDAATQTFGDLLGNGKTYVVPPFQRDYSWTEEEWEDLWFDLVNAEEDEEHGGHYMGYAVLQTRDGKHHEVIDGQQRLATLSILCLAGLKHLQSLADSGVDSEANIKRFELLRSRFIGHVVASSLTPVSKLRLNRNDDDFYQSYLVQLRAPPPRSRAKPSQRLLHGAYDYFYRRIEEHLGSSLSGERLARFLESVGDRLIFTVITVANELRAYKVFETLNARGVKLSATDLLKNYLFSLVHARSPADLEEAERRWQHVTDALGAEDFPTFARHLWNATEALTRKPALFKAIKNRVRNSEEAFAFLDRLERNAPIYVALSQPEDPFWSREEREWLRALRTFNVSQFYPLALAVIERGLPQTDRASIFRVCAITALRYNVISGLNPSPIEDAYSKAARNVRSGDIRTAGQVFRLLQQAGLYVDDSTFESNFASKSIRDTNRSKRLIRYLLGELESRVSNRALNVDAQDVTIEHLLPQEYSEEWSAAFSRDEQELYVARLANYALLEGSLNREAGHEPWERKREILKRSAFPLTREAADYPEWTPRTLSVRAERIAKLAVAHWRLDF